MWCLAPGRPPARRQRLTGGRSGQGTVALLSELSQERPVAHADRPHQTVARRERQKRVAKPDQSTCWNQIFEPDAALAVVDDLEHLTAPLTESLGHRTEVVLSDVDREVLDRFHELAVDPLHDGLGT